MQQVRALKQGRPAVEEACICSHCQEFRQLTGGTFLEGLAACAAARTAVDLQGRVVNGFKQNPGCDEACVCAVCGVVG